MGTQEEWEEDREESTRVGMRAREGTAFWADISSAHLRGAKMYGPIHCSPSTRFSAQAAQLSEWRNHGETTRIGRIQSCDSAFH